MPQDLLQAPWRLMAPRVPDNGTPHLSIDYIFQIIEWQTAENILN
jgi:hypothetical protein